MTDFELKSKIKSVPLPEYSEEYWSDFPRHIRLQLQRQSTQSTPRRRWHMPLLLVGDFALTIVLVLVCIQCHPLQAATAAITQHEQKFHGQLARLDTGLHRLMLNTDGMSYLLADVN